ncbi:SRPBCC family protein [Mycolicibacillus parakoreensis]|uniref:SRPBCC family protein n=1 Tax=Mycolicibacillus parakoreensis TaxID=1069221 RepID=A0ABY3U456_9MYCO|nr:SRPBCC family protein [Mycolicibacillus parakoreensis]MCV7316506.1 SRPBCC family protein [Mycolicibacillus parakoreensis]ULN52735.1 SRPBCC family protein [Mycolicibacillus parakoreensis]HLR99063.1 SRPBCC family protein [Mycolicibacillus parakoreensis]
MEWTGARYADSPSVTASTRIAAAPTRVWRWVCDITVMPELSTELQSVEWTGPERRPVLGATFVGHNHNPAIGSWQAPAQIIACDENTEFAWAVGDRDNPAAIWRFRLAADDADPPTTTLSYTAQLGPGPSGLSAAIEAMPEKEQKIVFVRLREFHSAITATVAAIKDLAEGDRR